MGVVLTSPQCGGTHAFIPLLKGLGLALVGRHYSGEWFAKGVRKHKFKVNGTPIEYMPELPIKEGQFITGHSAPFKTDHRVISVLRDPRNIMICHFNRRGFEGSFDDWLISAGAYGRAKIIPRNWGWNPSTCGSQVLRVWYEEIRDIEAQRAVADFCGVEWRETRFWGDSKTWSGHPSNHEKVFTLNTEANFNRIWTEITGQGFDKWLRKNS